MFFMGYLNWSSTLDRLDLGFLKPLLGAISKTYDRQWESTSEILRQKDPYGSSITEQKLLKAKNDLVDKASKAQADIIINFFKAQQQKKMEELLEKQRKAFESKIASLKAQMEASQSVQGKVSSPPYGVPLGVVVNPEAIGAAPPDMSFPAWYSNSYVYHPYKRRRGYYSVFTSPNMQ